MTIESLRAALCDILANKLRCGLTILGILTGTAAVILLVAIGVGVSNRVQGRIQDIGTNSLYLIPETNEAGEDSGTDARRADLTEKDVRALSDKHRNPAISVVAPTQETTGTVTWQGSSHALKAFQGSPPAYTSIRNMTVKTGRLLTEEDESNHAKVALIGSSVAQRLMRKGFDPVGQDVEFNGVRLRVVGLLTSKGSHGGEDEDDVMVAPLTTTLDHIVGSRESYSHVVAQAVSREALPAAIEQVTVTLRQTHGLKPEAAPDFSVFNAAELVETAESAAAGLEAFLAAIALISLIVGGIGVMNIMLVTVTERTHEIGIRKAVGAQNRDVLTQFLVEAMVLAGLGGILGVIVGVALGQIPIGETQPVVLPSTAVMSFGVSVLVGVFFGVYPARRAAALTPIEALRYE
ncbi:MAG TPA: ABC transporter permease [Acidimicrobiia bacterium]|nr:ABC transporter permease [Acidimicrobiia bacterium]